MRRIEREDVEALYSWRAFLRYHLFWGHVLIATIALYFWQRLTEDS